MLAARRVVGWAPADRAIDRSVADVWSYRQRQGSRARRLGVFPLFVRLLLYGTIPHAISAHAGAGINEQDDPLTGAGIIGGRIGLPEKRAGKSQGNHDEQGAANEQEQYVFQSTFASDTRQIGLQEHE